MAYDREKNDINQEVLSGFYGRELRLVRNLFRRNPSAKALTQMELASLMGVSQGYISYLERSRNAVPAELMEKFANALSLTHDQFLETWNSSDKKNLVKGAESSRVPTKTTSLCNEEDYGVYFKPGMLKDFRRLKGMNQKIVAQELGINVVKYAQLEKGFVPLTEDSENKLRKFFGLDEYSREELLLAYYENRLDKRLLTPARMRYLRLSLIDPQTWNVGLSQKRFAQILCLPPALVSFLETGKSAISNDLERKIRLSLDLNEEKLLSRIYYKNLSDVLQYVTKVSSDELELTKAKCIRSLREAFNNGKGMPLTRLASLLSVGVQDLMQWEEGELLPDLAQEERLIQVLIYRRLTF
jgi:transcriptional regulator with XRE-family HTH domain